MATKRNYHRFIYKLWRVEAQKLEDKKVPSIAQTQMDETFILSSF